MVEICSGGTNAQGSGDDTPPRLPGILWSEDAKDIRIGFSFQILLRYEGAKGVQHIFIAARRGIVLEPRKYLRPNEMEVMAKSDEISNLIQILREGELSHRMGAVQALVQLGEEAVDSLLCLFPDPDWKMWKYAVSILGEIHPHQSGEFLIPMLNDSHTQVRRTVVKVLGNIEDPQIIPHLIRVMVEDKDFTVRKTAAWILDKSGWIPAHPPEQVIFYIARSNYEKAAEIGEPAVDSLLTLLQDADEPARSGAARALKRMKNARAVNPLIQAVQDPDVHVREHAMEALRKLVGEVAIFPLIQAQSDQVLPLLIPALQDDNKSVRKNAALILEELNDPRTVDPLIQALEDPEVRAIAARMLSALGNLRAVVPLCQTLEDSDEMVRAGAIKSLEELLPQMEDQTPVLRKLQPLLLDPIRYVRYPAWAVFEDLLQQNEDPSPVVKLLWEGFNEIPWVEIDAKWQATENLQRREYGLDRIGQAFFELQKAAFTKDTADFDMYRSREELGEIFLQIIASVMRHPQVRSLFRDAMTVSPPWKQIIAIRALMLNDAVIPDLDRVMEILLQALQAFRVEIHNELTQWQRDMINPRIPILLETFTEEQWIPKIAPKALGSSTDIRIYEVLTQALNDDRDEIYRCAKWTLIALDTHTRDVPDRKVRKAVKNAIKRLKKVQKKRE